MITPREQEAKSGCGCEGAVDPGTKLGQVAFSFLCALLAIYFVQTSDWSASWFTDMNHSSSNWTSPASLIAYYEDGRYPWEGWIFLLTGARPLYVFAMMYAGTYAIALAICLILLREVPIWAEAAALFGALVLATRTTANWGGGIEIFGYDHFSFVGVVLLCGLAGYLIRSAIMQWKKRSVAGVS